MKQAAARWSAIRLLVTHCIEINPGVHAWQVYRAVRKGVQDAAVKLLTNVDAGQLAVFNEVRTPSCRTHLPWTPKKTIKVWMAMHSDAPPLLALCEHDCHTCVSGCTGDPAAEAHQLRPQHRAVLRRVPGVPAAHARHGVHGGAHKPAARLNICTAEQDIAVTHLAVHLLGSTTSFQPAHNTNALQCC